MVDGPSGVAHQQAGACLVTSADGDLVLTLGMPDTTQNIKSHKCRLIPCKMTFSWSSNPSPSFLFGSPLREEYKVQWEGERLQKVGIYTNDKLNKSHHK